MFRLHTCRPCSEWFVLVLCTVSCYHNISMIVPLISRHILTGAGEEKSYSRFLNELDQTALSL